MNPNRPTPRHIIIKMTVVKEGILKAATEAESYTREPLLSADFSAETLPARREWHDIFQVL